jgi:hypothetical protein
MDKQNILDYLNTYYKNTYVIFDSEIQKWIMIYNENIVWSEYKGEHLDQFYIQGNAEKNDGFIKIAVFDNQYDNLIPQIQSFINNINFEFKKNQKRIKINESIFLKYNNCKHQ